ncbi:hypothetical protein ABLM29_07230, partial [Nocardioides sp. YIM 152588]
MTERVEDTAIRPGVKVDEGRANGASPNARSTPAETEESPAGTEANGTSAKAPKGPPKDAPKDAPAPKEAPKDAPASSPASPLRRRAA